VSLLELLTGEPPSSSGSARRLRASRPPPEALQQLHSSAPPGVALEELLLSMTAFEPTDRPADAREVAQRLRAMLDDVPEDAGTTARASSQDPPPEATERPARTGSDRP
jgi:hypothetical protein